MLRSQKTESVQLNSTPTKQYKDVEFKNVHMFSTFYQYGHRYTKVNRNQAELDDGTLVYCDPTNIVSVQIKTKNAKCERNCLESR